MIVRILIFLICGFLVENLPAQSNPIQGKVVDQDDQPLYLALVYNADLGIGVYTDENGFFEIYTDQFPGKLEVFALGFLRKYIQLENRDIFLNIVLDKLTYDLKEIEVTPCPKTEFILGLKPKQTISHRHSGSRNISYQIGKSFPTDYGQEITAVEIHSINPTSKRATFRLRIYSLDSEGNPDEDLLLETLIVTVPRWRQRRPTVIDLSDYNLRSPNTGILVAKEWLPGENNRHRITHRNAEGKRVDHYVEIPSIGLIRTNRNPDYNMWSKRDEGEWSLTNLPILDRKDDDEMLIPAIKVHVRDCKGSRSGKN